MAKAEIIQHEPERLPQHAVTPMEMIDRALSSGAGIEVIEKLMGLQERWEANQGRKAYDRAIAEARGEIKPVIKGQKANRGNAGSYDYENLADISQQIDPILSKRGLSYRFRTRTEGGRVFVTCILSHRDGYSEETTLDSPPDTSGAKNPIQAMGSAVTYLQRYTLKAGLGLSASKDDDGNAAGGNSGPISADQYQALRALLEETGRDEAKFCRFYQIEQMHDLPAAKFDAARADILAAERTARKKAEEKADA